MFCIKYSRLFRVSHQKNIKKWLIIEKYKNKIENWITFKNKAGYHILTPDTIKLLASTEKKKIPKNENRENVPDSEITEVYYDIVNNGYQHDLRVICSIQK